MTLFTSEKNSKAIMRTLYIWIGVTAFVALFGFIYELNSHNVYSASMTFAWRYPLILGVAVYLAMRFIPTRRVPGILPASIYAFGVSMATVRSIFIGVIDIYGTTNKNMVTIYTILMHVFFGTGLVLYLIIIIYWTFKKDKTIETE